ncbi:MULTISPECIES: hypothetical protein [Mycobacteriaceae]|uniref:Uncharacterized protein n=1 Tax=Mycolicibacter minnesotensis TaxID=1118379 RepID=A0A7I7R476_9MYCO|nr:MULTISPECIES: hypothetical protein [Mycobacteriaceae]MCV7166501.1 hypothetical protein [Mycobacterium stomatepiae]ORB01045.1 hypothetical protein BST33_09690 [Mycolicibacter minnesotensis]BBY33429.1 hypothetical protein MMIN_14900 [Mycolicibacter minnesotensis]
MNPDMPPEPGRPAAPRYSRVPEETPERLVPDDPPERLAPAEVPERLAPEDPPAVPDGSPGQ